jgi:hypothetical protein
VGSLLKPTEGGMGGCPDPVLGRHATGGGGGPAPVTRGVAGGRHRSRACGRARPGL